MNQRFLLLGSGEFEPWVNKIDLWLAGVKNPKVLVIPTASAPESDKVFYRWGNKGIAHYKKLGINAEILDLKTRGDAHNENLMDKLDEASAVFFSGGNPYYLVQVLDNTPFYAKLKKRIKQGMGYGGCSAGMIALGYLSHSNEINKINKNIWKKGLKLFPKVLFSAHFDQLDNYIPGIREFMFKSLSKSKTLVGIDEFTAAYGDGVNFKVFGKGKVHIKKAGNDLISYTNNKKFKLD